MTSHMEELTEVWKVGIGEYKVTPLPNCLKTIGLGSCVGVAIYDPFKRVGGLSHIMLPDSTVFNGEVKAGKFADLAIPLMMEDMLNIGAKHHNLQAKISGGSSMFPLTNQLPQAQIGRRNIEAVKEILKKMKIPLLGENTGGSAGRTMWLDLEDMTTRIRIVNQEIIEI